MEVNVTELLSYLLSLPGLLPIFILHFLRAEHSRTRRILLKVFARWIELPLLKIIYEVCQGRLRFMTRSPLMRRLTGITLTRPFAKYADTGVPVPMKHVVRLIRALDGPISVGDCRCRLAKKTCHHPMQTDLVFRTGAEAWLWAFPENYRLISKDEAINIVKECNRLGMFPMVFIHCSSARHVNEYVICNCCTCGCKVHLLNRTVGQQYFPLPDGGFRSFVQSDMCNGCGECVHACPFDAISMGDQAAEINGCFGCGVCEAVCPTGALEVRRVGPGPPWAQQPWREIQEQENSA